MKVLLIDPPGINKGINTGLGYIAAMLRKKEHDFKVLDLNNDRNNINERINSALKENPKAVGISINSFNEKEGLRIARYIKERIKTTCILGGPGVTINYKEILEKNNDVIDCVMISEAEYTIINFLEKLENGKDFHDIDGIAYYRKGVVKNKDQQFIELNSLPFPDYTKFDTYNKDLMKQYQIVTSRGCPFSCAFCANKALWKQRFRTRTPENVVEEMKHAKDFYKSEIILICDDNFSMDMDRAKDICRLMIKERIDLPYVMFNGMRADRIDEELASLLKKSGCEEISIGIENGDKETFEYVRKCETLEDIEKAVKIIKKAGIGMRGFVVIGLINTTKQSDLRSLKFVEKLKISANWNIAIPYPGIELYDWVKKNGTFLINELRYDMNIPACPPLVFFETKDYPKEDRIFMYKLANLRAKNYYFLYKEKNVNWFRKFIHIMKIAWDVDKKRLPFYALHFWGILFKLFLKKYLIRK